MKRSAPKTNSEKVAAYWSRHDRLTVALPLGQLAELREVLEAEDPPRSLTDFVRAAVARRLRKGARS